MEPKKLHLTNAEFKKLSPCQKAIYLGPRAELYKSANKSARRGGNGAGRPKAIGDAMSFPHYFRHELGYSMSERRIYECLRNWQMGFDFINSLLNTNLDSYVHLKVLRNMTIDQRQAYVKKHARALRRDTVRYKNMMSLEDIHDFLHFGVTSDVTA